MLLGHIIGILPKAYVLVTLIFVERSSLAGSGAKRLQMPLVEAMLMAGWLCSMTILSHTCPRKLLKYTSICALLANNLAGSISLLR